MTVNSIEQVGIELTTTCNLRCPLCARNIKTVKDGGFLNRPMRSADEWIRQLRSFSSLKLVEIDGRLSEPTLHPGLTQIIDDLVLRGVKLDLYTNGDLHANEWWKELADHLTSEDRVIFTVCGSTQELHSKYRVGSDLKTMLTHCSAFRTAKKNDWCQHILFEYNREDLESGAMDKIFSQFSHVLKIMSKPTFECFDVQADVGISLPRKQHVMYKFALDQALSQRAKLLDDHTYELECPQKKQHMVWIDVDGKVYPCCKYLYCTRDPFSIDDYSAIESYKYEFCAECESHMARLIEKYGVEQTI